MLNLMMHTFSKANTNNRGNHKTNIIFIKETNNVFECVW